MKKIILLVVFIFVFVFNSVLAEDWNGYSDVGNMWEGQKSITNKEFEEVVEALEQNKKKKEQKKEARRIKKISGGGKSLHSDDVSDVNVAKIDFIDNKKEGMLLNVPVNLIIDDIFLEKGFYKVIAEVDKNNDIYLLFYQSRFYKGKVKANETTNDYNQSEVNFVNLLPYNDNFIKIIYGSLDFNAYAYIRYRN